MSNPKQVGYQLGTDQLQRDAVKQAIETYFPSPQDLQYLRQQQAPTSRIVQEIRNGRLHIKRVDAT